MTKADPENDFRPQRRLGRARSGASTGKLEKLPSTPAVEECDRCDLE